MRTAQKIEGILEILWRSNCGLCQDLRRLPIVHEQPRTNWFESLRNFPIFLKKNSPLGVCYTSRGFNKRQVERRASRLADKPKPEAPSLPPTLNIFLSLIEL